jgi:glucokinase
MDHSVSAQGFQRWPDLKKTLDIAMGRVRAKGKAMSIQKIQSEDEVQEVLAVDLGGSKVAMARVGRQGELLQNTRTPTAEMKGGDDLVAWIEKQVKGWGIEPVAIGISTGGPLDDERGMITRWPRMEMLWGYPLADSIQKRLPSIQSVKLVNDACAACAGEVLFGAAQGLRRVLYITISTGIGGGAVMGGTLLRGEKGNVAEFGHSVVRHDGPYCDCGTQGCLEAVASASGLYHQYVAAGLLEKTNRGWANLGYWLKEQLEAGRKEILPIWEEALAGLATGLVNMWNSFVPQAIVVGGGLSALVQQYQKDLDKLLAERACLMPIPAGVIRWSDNRHTIPLLGAAGVAGGWIPHEQ